MKGSDMEEKFKALVTTETSESIFQSAIQGRSVADLPPGDLLIAVHYSSVNYKDFLSATGNRGVTRVYPHTPGIDAAGVVVESRDPAFHPGDPVIVTSYDLGMNIAGGFGQYIRVPAAWAVPLPEGMTLRESMIYGTAGFTAALSLHYLIRNNITPQHGVILVSGATGGVGCLAVAMLAGLGYDVAAVNGRIDQTLFLKSLGAGMVIDSAEVLDETSRPLLKSRWAGAIDTVGGKVLAATLKAMQPYGIVTCCGNVASPELPMTVYPFILRGITLIGVDSQNCPMPLRRYVWRQLAGEWRIKKPNELAHEIQLAQLPETIAQWKTKRPSGRVIVHLIED